MTHDDDRPKKSWREIDKQREGSSHRRDEKSSRGGRVETSAAYRSYKSQLNKLFEGGGAKEPKEKKAAVQAIVDARLPKEIAAAVQAHREQFGFPDNEDALLKILDASDEALLLEAMQTISALHGEGRLKRGVAIKARVRTVETTMDDPDLQAAAKKLLSLL